MRIRTLLLRNLTFHWRAHLAVLLGAAIGTAVLTGALLVGDSLRGSLAARADEQRAGIDYALVANRFFSAAPSSDAGTVRAGIVLRGSISAGEGDLARHLNNVTILAGLDFGGSQSKDWGNGETAALPASLAERLNVRAGESITVRVPIPATVPSESLLGQREAGQTMLEMAYALQAVLREDDPASQFRLYPGFGEPRNVILPAAGLQAKLARLMPWALPSNSSLHNAILASGDIKALTDSLRGNLRMSDWDLKWADNPLIDRPVAKSIRVNSPTLVPKLAAAIDKNGDGTLSPDEIEAWRSVHGYMSLESRRGILEATTAQAAVDAAYDAKMQAAPTLVYLANSISHGDKSIPYSIVAAVPYWISEARGLAPGPLVPRSADGFVPELREPFGPFLPPFIRGLHEDEIVLTDWAESPLLNLPIGSPIKLTYFLPELQDGRFVESSTNFKLSGYLPLKGQALDPYLTPQFAGVTDRLSVRDWSPPFPYDNTKMGPRDEKYWREYRTIPKAYVTLTTGRKLWASRYGDSTSVRIAPPPNNSWSEARREFEPKMLARLNPADGGFVFDDLKARFAAASQGGQDFGGLFLGFSFFLIVSALLLVGLMMRLNLERRASEIGILLATGWRIRTIRILLMVEGLAVASLGAIAGLGAAIGYAAGMLALLRWLWPDRSVGNFLALHVSGESLAIGFVAMVLTSAGTIWWSLRWFAKVPAAALIGGSSEIPENLAKRRTFAQRIVLPVLAILLVAGIAALAGGAQIANPEMRAMSFFGGGALLLVAALMIVWRWLKRQSRSTLTGHGVPALGRLGSRNAKRNPARSILTAGLLASAAFLLVAVESFRREPEKDFARQNGGSGGCPILINTTLPIFKDLNSGGRDDLLANLQMHYQQNPEPGATPNESLQRARETLDAATIYSFRKSSGDDASCLNLYQAGKPQMLGAPARLIDEGGFHFIESEAETAEEKANPWLLLRRQPSDGAIPVIGEENSLTWMLKVGLGEELTIPDDSGAARKLRVVGILKDSVFQSELVASSENVAKLFPRAEGFTYHLVRVDPEHADAVGSILRLGLARYQPEFTRTKNLVATYMAVENTYLTTFQLLGGLGLVLGALGLAVVMLRGVWERRSELALLQALGYRHRDLRTMVLAENALLLVLGLAAGIATAVLSVIPHIAEGGSVPWLRLGELLALVIVVGMFASALAIRSTLRLPLLASLRKE